MKLKWAMVIAVPCLLVAVAAAAWAAGQAKVSAPEVIRAQSFELVDAEGRVQAKLAVHKDGPGLILFDHGGKVRAMLAVDKNGVPMLGLLDEKASIRAAVSVPTEGDAGLVLPNQPGRGGAMLAVDKDGGPVLILLGKDGKMLWEAP